MFRPDIGHFNVIEMRHPLLEVDELAEDGHIIADDFRAFTFANAIKLWVTQNPRFFEGTRRGREREAGDDLDQGSVTLDPFRHCDAWTAIPITTSVAAAAGCRNSRKSSRPCRLRKADRAPRRSRRGADRRVFECPPPHSRRDRALLRQVTG
jgi:hypothetical protein